jgi:hypothetical protein
MRHWERIVASDFFTVEVWTQRGWQRFIVLFFIDLSTPSQTRRTTGVSYRTNPA